MKRPALVFLVALTHTACGAPQSGTGSLHDGAASAKAAADGEVDKECKQQGIETIAAMPVRHGDASAGTFAYRYQHFVEDEEAMTIVYLPGGPGQDAINDDDFLKSYGSYNRVYIEPRGVGCNYPGTESFGAAELTTLQHAKDVVAVIEAIKPRKYVIYGISYGTVVGTVAAFEAERSARKPHAVVLEGVLGKVFTGEVRQTFDVEWNRIVDESPAIEALLAGDGPRHGYDKEQWKTLIRGLLNYSRAILKDQLEAIAAIGAEGGPTELSKDQKAFIDSVVNEPASPKGTQRFWQMVACRELFASDTAIEFDWRGARLSPKKTPPEVWREMCGTLRLDAAYDPARYRLTSPVYYVQGTADPATPLAQARAHRQAQTRAAKTTWIEVADGSHAPSIAVDQLAPCISSVWSRIESLEGEMDGVLDERGRCVAAPGDGESEGYSLRDASPAQDPVSRIRRAQQ